MYSSNFRKMMALVAARSILTTCRAHERKGVDVWMPSLGIELRLFPYFLVLPTLFNIYSIDLFLLPVMIFIIKIMILKLILSWVNWFSSILGNLTRVWLASTQAQAYILFWSTGSCSMFSCKVLTDLFNCVLTSNLHLHFTLLFRCLILFQPACGNMI